MPRKPKLPVPVLRIEGLSDGREIRSEVVAGDFGEVVPIAPDTRPARYVLTPKDIEGKAARNKAKQHKAVMVLVGWGDKVGYVAPSVDVIPAGQMLIGKIKLKDGSELALLKAKPPFRRI